MITHDLFDYHLKGALQNLHSTVDLQVNPLSELLVDGAGLEERGRALRQVLLEAIGRLKPETQPAADSLAWTGYEVLRLRYVEGLAPQQVCAQLSVSRASLYRHHERAFAALSSLLWTRYQARLAAQRAGRAACDSAVEEAVRLAQQSTGQLVAPAELLEGVLRTLAPLATERGVVLRWTVAQTLPQLFGDPAWLRQILLNILTEAMLCTSSTMLLLSAGVERGPATWCLRGLRPGELSAEELDTLPGIRLARALLRVYGETLWLSKDDEGLPVLCFVLPISRSLRILVVDDAEADARLYRLYLASRRCVVELARNQQELAERLAQGRPDLIILDVLMPRWDGWTVLQQLKTLPDTASIPIVICSVLSQPELALSLGAAEVLQKPVSEEALLQAVDRSIA